MKKVLIQQIKTLRQALLLIVAMVFLSSVVAHASSIPSMNLDQLEKEIVAHKGKVVMLNFFASWCPPCREEIPSLIELNKEYGDKVVFIGLSVDENANALEDFAKSVNFTYPVYKVNNAVAAQYSVSAIPHNAVYDRSGTIVANQAGYIPKQDLKKFLDSLQ